MSHPRISRLMFQMVAKNGAEYGYASLQNGNCAILCDGVLLEEFKASSDEAARRGVLRFRHLVERAIVGTPRSPLADVGIGGSGSGGGGGAVALA